MEIKRAWEIDGEKVMGECGFAGEKGRMIGWGGVGWMCGCD